MGEQTSPSFMLSGYPGVAVVSRQKRLVGYDPESKDLDTDQLRKYLFGGHISEYMRHLMDEDEECYQQHFSAYIKENIGPDEVSCCS